MKYLNFLLQFSIICLILFQLVVTVPKWHHVKNQKNAIAKNKKQYLIEDNFKYTWFEASNECARRGLQLVKINDSRKNERLVKLLEKAFGSSINLWIGAHDEFDVGQQNRTFRWESNGAELEFAYWSPHNPDNAKSMEHCVHISNMSPEFRWSDSRCRTKFGFICEKYPTKLSNSCERHIQETVDKLKGQLPGVVVRFTTKAPILTNMAAVANIE